MTNITPVIKNDSHNTTKTTQSRSSYDSTSTSVYFDNKVFQDLEKLTNDLKKAVKNPKKAAYSAEYKATIKEVTAWIKKKTQVKLRNERLELENDNTANLVSIQMATLINSISNKEIFQISVERLAKINPDQDTRKRLKEAVIAAGISQGKLSLKVCDDKSEIHELTAGRKQTVEIEVAEKINKYFKKKKLGIIFNFKSILESAKNECNDTISGKEHLLQEAGHHENEPVSKEMKKQSADNNASNNLTPQSEITTNNSSYSVAPEIKNSAESERNDTISAKKRSLQEAGHHGNEPVLKKARTQAANNNTGNNPTTTHISSHSVSPVIKSTKGAGLKNDNLQHLTQDSIHQAPPSNWGGWEMFEISKVLSQNPGFARDTN